MTENAVEGQLDYTSRLGYGLAWKRGGARSTYTAGNNYLISTHAHSDQPSPAPLPMLTYFNLWLNFNKRQHCDGLYRKNTYHDLCASRVCFHCTRYSQTSGEQNSLVNRLGYCTSGPRANFKNVARLKIKAINFNLDILLITKCTYSLRGCRTSPPDLRLKRRECFTFSAIVKCTHVHSCG